MTSNRQKYEMECDDLIIYHGKSFIQQNNQTNFQKPTQSQIQQTQQSSVQIRYIKLKDNYYYTDKNGSSQLLFSLTNKDQAKREISPVVSEINDNLKKNDEELILFSYMFTAERVNLYIDYLNYLDTQNHFQYLKDMRQKNQRKFVFQSTLFKNEYIDLFANEYTNEKQQIFNKFLIKEIKDQNLIKYEIDLVYKKIGFAIEYKENEFNFCQLKQSDNQNQFKLLIYEYTQEINSEIKKKCKMIKKYIEKGFQQITNNNEYLIEIKILTPQDKIQYFPASNLLYCTQLIHHFFNEKESNLQEFEKMKVILNNFWYENPIQ